MKMASSVFGLGILVSTLLVACGDDDDPASSSQGSGASSSSSSGSGAAGASSSSAGGESSSGGAGGESSGGAGGEGTGGAGGEAGCESFTVDMAELRAESIARLDAFFGPQASFDDGVFWFNEGMGAFGACPAYPAFDYTSVVYVAPIPAELVPPEAGERKVGVSWGLNGVPDIWLVPPDDQPGNLFFNGRSPVSGIIMLDPATTTDQQNALFAKLEAAHPSAMLQNLMSVQMIIYLFGDQELDGNEPPGLYAEVLALLDDARDEPEVTLIELDGFVYPDPSQFADPVAIPRTTEPLAPECLRDITKDHAGKFEGEASFPEPFGAGWMEDATPCE